MIHMSSGVISWYVVLELNSWVCKELFTYLHIARSETMKNIYKLLTEYLSYLEIRLMIQR